MTPASKPSRSPYAGILDRARDLAHQVRCAAERIHQQAEESHRLIEAARRQVVRGREISRQARGQACFAHRARWQLELAAPKDDPGPQ